LFLLLAVVFLFPVAVYLTILALVNRRTQPVVVSGVTECIGLLFAASGLLLVVAPAILSNWYHKFLEDTAFEPRGDTEPVPFLSIWALWWGIWVLYYLLVLGGAALMLWWRRRRTIIYNVDPAVLEKLLREAFEKRGFETNRLGNRLFVGAAEVPLALDENLPALEPFRATARRAERAMLDVESFPAFCNVTLHWHADSSGVREEVERELTAALAPVRTFDNSAGTWLFMIAGLIFALIFLAAVAVVIGIFLAVRK
jgi:hypothetical protein